MNSFYLSIITVGILLIVFSLILIAIDRKKAADHSELLDDKKAEILGVLQDADEMIHELNRLSDYVITQMDAKNVEFNQMLDHIGEKVATLKAELIANEIVKDRLSNMVVNGPPAANFVNAVAKTEEIKQESKIIPEPYRPPVRTVKPPNHKAKDNVIPINSKYKEAIRLSQNGLAASEIAKQLNMGKGEIELVLGVSQRKV